MPRKRDRMFTAEELARAHRDAEASSHESLPADPRLAELRRKLKDPAYMDRAINGAADRIVDRGLGD